MFVAYRLFFPNFVVIFCFVDVIFSNIRVKNLEILKICFRNLINILSYLNSLKPREF